jgi:hypothetical protein
MPPLRRLKDLVKPASPNPAIPMAINKSTLARRIRPAYNRPEVRTPIHIADSDAFIGEEILSVTHPADRQKPTSTAFMQPFVPPPVAGTGVEARLDAIESALAAFDKRLTDLEQQVSGWEKHPWFRFVRWVTNLWSRSKP